MNAIKLTGPEIQQNLDLIESSVLQNRKELAEKVLGRILANAAWHGEHPFYMDDIPLGDLHPKSRNCVGPVIRKLMREGLIAKTGRYKKSARQESQGRVIWEYRLT